MHRQAWHLERFPQQSCVGAQLLRFGQMHGFHKKWFCSILGTWWTLSLCTPLIPWSTSSAHQKNQPKTPPTQAIMVSAGE